MAENTTISEGNTYESNVTGALRNYYIYGISPGSFTTALIKDDYDEAFICAHTNIKTEKIIRGLMAGMKTMIPPQCLGKNYNRWMEQGGLKGATQEERFTIRLSGNWMSQ